MTKHILAIALASLLAACGNDGSSNTPTPASTAAPASLEGSYKSADGKHTLTFSSDMKVKTVVLGTPVETVYAIEDRTVKFKFPDGLPVTYAINADGSLTAPTGTRHYKD